jgi:phospholipase C
MMVISPWSKGGYVNSQVFDHTSLIRFLEQRFGHRNPALTENNITRWRRTVAGDLTSCFNFATPNEVVVPSLPNTAAYAPPTAAEIAAGTRFDDYVPVPPITSTVPRQEPGTRRARALPYRPAVHAVADKATQGVTLTFGNHGPVGIAYHVRQAGAGAAGPWTFTIAPQHTASNTWTLGANGSSSVFDLSVHGPNGFYRRYQGSVAQKATDLIIDTHDAMHEHHDSVRDDALRVTIHNSGPIKVVVMITDVYAGKETFETIPAGGRFSKDWNLAANHNWYDLIVQVVGDGTFRQQLAGHVESGRDSYTDPAMGNSG